MKEIKVGQIIPYGFSYRNNTKTTFAAKTIFMRLPLFYQHTKKYDICSDEMLYKKWVFQVMFCLDIFSRGIGIRIIKSWA